MGNNGSLRRNILEALHSSSVGGHSCITATYQRVKRLFYWPNLKEEVYQFVKGCENCQINKSEHLHSPGLLQPLPIPNEAWSSIGMDFVSGLPKSKGNDVIMVTLDRFTKYAHFIALAHPFKAKDVA